MLLVHAVGGGDLGLTSTRTVPVLNDTPEATGTDRRPLRKLFEALPPVSALALLGTTNPGGPLGLPFAHWATEIGARLASEEGLCGVRLDPGAVHVVEVEEPRMEAASLSLTAWLARHRPERVLISYGSGAFALSAGALCAALETCVPTGLVHIDEPRRPYTLERPPDMAGHMESWLLRHRFWDALAETDPGDGELWRLLAARQAGDTRLAARTHASDTITRGELAKFAELRPTMQAALFERLGRGEAADHGLLRAWFGDRLRKLFRDDRDGLPVRVREQIERLITALGTRDDDQGHLSGRIRQTARLIDERVDAACVRLLRDQALTDLYARASTHRAHLLSEPMGPGPLPPGLLTAADQWERGDQGVRLVARTGRTGWPVLGSGDVLGLLAVGLDRGDGPADGRRDAEDRQAIRVVLTELRRRLDRLPRRGVPRLRLPASPEAARRAHALAGWASSVALDTDVRVIEDVSGGIERVREVIVTALRSEAAPTGRTGSGSPRDIDELLLVLNPGPPATNYGMIAASVEWSLTAACPLHVTELVGRGNAAPELRGGRPVLARLGADHVLARLTASAVHRLDLRTAVRLAGRGSSRLRESLPAIEELEKDLFGPAPSTWTEGEQRAAARRRLGLIAAACGDHPGLAVYLAVSALQPALFPWGAWKDMRESHPALRELGRRANEALHGHALDRLDRRGRSGNGADGRGDARAVLARAIGELGGPLKGDDELIVRHKSLIAELSLVYQENG
ncbi:hypothetical protein ABZ470_32540 [Streptosporangium sp. NPDC020072]|uniref:hypothetical protein n=1 Tax=Streptosporangium sp. NPDC020072 TaxID=3154788 RepID=UPI00343944B3